MYYVIIFSSFDLVALIIQAIGGAGAAQAQNKGTSTTTWSHVMVPLTPCFSTNG
jgi:RTA1 like protein